ncbi:MAG: hypothetical protein GX428_09520 [Candidatus Atribacteria bacterium]|nr:hypothetical protein [Candidatus Atribacteria bacterium]
MKKRILFFVLTMLILASCSSLFPSSDYPNVATPVEVFTTQTTQTPSIPEKTTETHGYNANSGTSDADIPICVNSNNPLPLSNLSAIDGAIIYRNHKGTEWFLLAGTPPSVQAINPLRKGADSIAFSNNGHGMLVYSQKPISSGLENHYPIWIISNAGKEKELIIDITSMVSIIKDQLSSTDQLIYWTFTWVNEKIVRVRAAFGETPDQELFNYIYGYFDVERGAWWDAPLMLISDRNDYDWYDFSTDLSRMVYTTKNNNFVLRDVETEKELWRIQAGTNQLPPFATWSFDNEMVAFWTDNKPQDIQMLSRDGSNYEIVPKPIFKDSFQEFIPYRGFFEWAPESYRLAITGKVINSRNDSTVSLLLIYDARLRKYIFQCPIGDTDIRTVGTNILWSPDGKFIIPETHQSKTIPFNLYDVSTHLVYHLHPPGFAGAVWLSEFPDDWK